MQTSRLTLLILSLNLLVDQGEKYPVDDIHKQIDNGTIFDDIREKYLPKYPGPSLGGFTLNKSTFPKDEAAILDALQRLANAVVSEDLGVEHKDNGLLYLAALLNELVQSSTRDVNIELG